MFGKLAGLAMPVPVQLGWAFFKRTWPLFVGLALCITLVFMQMRLNTAQAKLKAEADFRLVMKDTLDAPSSDGPMLIIIARVRITESKDRKAALTRISGETIVAKKRADVADAQLKREQIANAKEFAEARAQITALRSRKSSGNAVKDAAAIEEDSKSAWKGWK